MVATRPFARRLAGIDPAMSTCAMIQPPKTSPWTLASDGCGITRSATGLFGSCRDSVTSEFHEK